MADYLDLLRQTAERYGLGHRTDFLGRTMQLESQGDPLAYNKGSKASGLFQFIPSTAAAYDLKDPFNPTDNIDRAVRLTRDNEAALRKALGREPTDAELYLAHNQGAGGASSLLTGKGVKAGDVTAPANIAANFNSDPNDTAENVAKRIMAAYAGAPLPAAQPAASPSMPNVGNSKANAAQLEALLGGNAKKPALRPGTEVSAGGGFAEGFGSALPDKIDWSKLGAPPKVTPGGARDSSIADSTGVTGGNSGGQPDMLAQLMRLFG